MKSAPPPPLTQEAHIGTCVIQIFGSRSTKGWRVLRVIGATSTQVASAKAKPDAVKQAEDSAREGFQQTFHVKPAN